MYKYCILQFAGILKNIYIHIYIYETNQIFYVIIIIEFEYCLFCTIKTIHYNYNNCNKYIISSFYMHINAICKYVNSEYYTIKFCCNIIEYYHFQ